MNIKTIGGIALAAGFTLYAEHVCAYESGDLLVQLLAEGFYTGASGGVGQGTGLNYSSGEISPNPALNLTYFFTKNLAAHTVIAVPHAKVDVSGSGQSQHATSQWVLPLSLLGQYHFFSDEAISPYVGAGPTRAFFWEDDSQIGAKVKVDDTWGGLINFGVNFKIPDSHWVAVIDAKKYWLADTDVKVGTRKTGDVSLNPWFFGVGIGYTFSTPPLL